MSSAPTDEEVIRARARGKRKKYVTRRQRLRRHLRAWRLAFVAIGLALAVVLFFNWRSIYNYLRFSLMD